MLEFNCEIEYKIWKRPSNANIHIKYAEIHSIRLFSPKYDTSLFQSKKKNKCLREAVIKKIKM